MMKTELSKASEETARGCGKNTPVYLGKLNLGTSSSRIAPSSLGVDSRSLFAIWPKAGIMSNGKCYQLATLDTPTFASEYMLLPTPCRVDGRFMVNSLDQLATYYRRGHQDKTIWQCRLNGLDPTQTLAVYNYMMGFPPNWAKLDD